MIIDIDVPNMCVTKPPGVKPIIDGLQDQCDRKDTDSMWTSYWCLAVFFLITTQVWASSISGQETGAQRESVDAGKIYDFFTNDVVAQKFVVTIILQVSCV